jgi:hypothetical protein
MIAKELPKWKCHKIVHAAKIKEVVDDTKPENETDGSRLLVLEEPGFLPIRVNRDWVRKHEPSNGGYFVVYDDNYTSFSPAKAFEEGYDRI